APLPLCVWSNTGVPPCGSTRSSIGGTTEAAEPRAAGSRPESDRQVGAREDGFEAEAAGGERVRGAFPAVHHAEDALDLPAGRRDRFERFEGRAAGGHRVLDQGDRLAG